MVIHTLEAIATFVETAPDAMLVVDRDGLIRIANRRAAAMFGSEDDMIGRSVEELLPTHLAEIHRQHREAFWDEPTPRAMGAGLALVARRFDGTEFPVDVSLGLLEAGRQRFVSAAVRDITGQVAAQQRLATMAFIVSSSQEAIFSMDTDGVLTSWNRAAERLTGRQAPDLVGRPAVGNLGIADLELERVLVERALAGEHVERLRTELTRTDGHPVPIALTMAAIRDESGQIVGASGIARDVTEEVTTQDALATARVQVEETQRLAGIGLWAWDVDADAMEWSSGLYAITGVDPVDFDGDLAGHLALVDEAERDRVARAISEAVERGGHFEEEYPIIRADGERRWVLARGDVVIDPTTHRRALRGICQDLTERQRAIEALREADQLKDEFLGTISHELRTPLTSIIGFATLLADVVDDEQSSWLEIIIRNSNEMHGMVERILDFSRLQSGRAKIRLEVHSLGELIDDVLPLVTSPLAGHRIETDVDADVMVLADANATRRALVNLLTNAAKFSEEGTIVTVRGLEADGWGRIEVEDRGCGIPADELDAIFERFHQVGSHALAAKRGAGVGLSIVRGYVQAMGGEVTVTSEVGAGSTFALHLPLADL